MLQSYAILTKLYTHHVIYLIVVETEAALRNAEDSVSTEDAPQNEANIDDAKNAIKPGVITVRLLY